MNGYIIYAHVSLLTLFTTENELNTKLRTHDMTTAERLPQTVWNTLLLCIGSLETIHFVREIKFQITFQISTIQVNID